MKIGLLLGSFDPIHIAHINIASCVLNSGLCDKILFVVAKHNPWKVHKPASFDVRCEMVESALSPFGKKCEVSRVEEGEEEQVFSYVTIGKLKELYPNDELFLIAGTDTVNDIPNWKNFETHIKDKIELIEISRGEESINFTHGVPFLKKATYNEKWNEYKTYYKLVTLKLDISSSIIRYMIEQGMNPTPYVTQDVLNIIKRENLYAHGEVF